MKATTFQHFEHLPGSSWCFYLSFFIVFVSRIIENAYFAIFCVIAAILFHNLLSCLFVIKWLMLSVKTEHLFITQTEQRQRRGDRRESHGLKTSAQYEMQEI